MGASFAWPVCAGRWRGSVVAVKVIEQVIGCPEEAARLAREPLLRCCSNQVHGQAGEPAYVGHRKACRDGSVSALAPALTCGHACGKARVGCCCPLSAHSTPFIGTSMVSPLCREHATPDKCST